MQMTRLSCPRFQPKEARLGLSVTTRGGLGAPEEGREVVADECAAAVGEDRGGG
jgi:hypothetical protein